MSRRLAYHNAEPVGALPYRATTDAVKAEFGKRLNKALLDKGMTQSDLAREASKFRPGGKSFGRYSISTYIRGKSLPRPDQMNAIAKALGVDRDALLPTESVPNVDEFDPPFDLRAMEDGRVWLRINQPTDFKTAMKIMESLNLPSDGGAHA